MRELTFHTLDVFTTTPFGGNPLAVFPDAPELDTALMQSIAREFNLSETVFVRPASTAGALRRLRIFTPGAELPFAGHPTVGTAQLLVELGVAPSADGGESRFTLEEGVGLVPVTVQTTAGGGRFTWFGAPRLPERTCGVPEPAALAGMLGLAPDEVVTDARDAPAVYSAGVPFTCIPLRDRDALARARLDIGRWREMLASGAAPQVYVFCHDDADGAARVRARMFAPGLGVMEDPATGGAAAAFAGYLWQRSRVSGRWTIVQGVEMGRPSTIEVGIEGTDGRLSSVQIGGGAVRMSTGVMLVPTGA